MRSPVTRKEIALVEERLAKVLGACHVIEAAITADEEVDKLFTWCLDIFDEMVTTDDAGEPVDDISRRIMVLARAITERLPRVKT